MAIPARHITDNFFTALQKFELVNEVSSGNTTFGNSIVSVEVREIDDTTNLTSQRVYAVTMVQRITVPGPSASTTGSYQVGAYSPSNGYQNYPAIVKNEVTVAVNNSNPNVIAAGIFPKTVNTAVSTSGSAGTGSQATQTEENSSGSSQANVNTFGVSVSDTLSLTKVLHPTISGSAQMSTQSTKNQSTSSGSSSGTNQNANSAASMSIKDWSAYGMLDDEAVNPTWIFGQGYPWDVIMYNQTTDSSSTDDSGKPIALPSFVARRLVGTYNDGSVVMAMPPSQLSLFGLDFQMTSTWLIEFPEPLTEDETIQLSFATTYYTASHYIDTTTSDLVALLQDDTTALIANYSLTAPLSLSVYSLSPLDGTGTGNGTAISFETAPFSIVPSGESAPFKVVSPGNNLQASGTGFGADMNTTFSSGGQATVTFTFKVQDYGTQYALYLMHWISSTDGACTIDWSVNSGKGTGAIVVDRTRNEGGQENFSSIELRNTDFTASGFHDFLVIGTNTIELTITPGNSSMSYQLFAAAIGVVAP